MDGRATTTACEEYRLLSGLVSGELELKDDELEFRGRHYDIREAKRLLKKVDKELEEDRQYFEGIDRRTFLVYYQMAMQADADMRKELFRRYDFHLTCQDMLRKLNAEKSHMEAVLEMVARKQQPLDPHEFRACLKACRDAQKSLKKVLKTADDLPMPDMANMRKGKPVGHFLLDRKLVYSLDADENSVSAQWINGLMSQIERGTVEAEADSLQEPGRHPDPAGPHPRLLAPAPGVPAHGAGADGGAGGGQACAGRAATGVGSSRRGGDPSRPPGDGCIPGRRGSGSATGAQQAAAKLAAVAPPKPSAPP